jgi:CRISPR-associated endonuclease/helicase Cas3
VYHCLDVAACADILLKTRTTWVDKIARVSGLPEDYLCEWLTFLLTIHDIGKFSDGFQSVRPDLQKELQQRTARLARGPRHDTIGYELLMTHFPAWCTRDDLARYGGSALRLWVSSVTGHHGLPPRNDSTRATLLRDHFPATVLSDAESYFADATSLVLPHGCPLPLDGVEQIELYKQGSWLVAGLAVVTDWLGSNTKWFSYRHPDMSIQDYWETTALR